jgi:hypothetical protein
MRPSPLPPLPLSAPEWLRALQLLPCAACSLAGPHRTLVALQDGGGYALCPAHAEAELLKNVRQNLSDVPHPVAPAGRVS